MSKLSSDIVNIPLKKLNRIFPDYKKVDKSKLKITNVGMYSVSKVQGSEKLIHLIKKYAPTIDVNINNITITDATGNVGSDTINLAIHFKHVNSIELSNEQYPVLKHNVSTYKLKNVNVINGDSLVVLPTLTQDVIYIDAPWGGIDYKDAKTLGLYLGTKELAQIYREYNQYCKLLIFKVPKNYDFNEFIRLSQVHKFILHTYINYSNEVKFYFIICYRN